MPSSLAQRCSMSFALRAESSWARDLAQPPSRSGCTFTQTRSCHWFNSSVPCRPGSRRCQWWLPAPRRAHVGCARRAYAERTPASGAESRRSRTNMGNEAFDVFITRDDVTAAGDGACFHRGLEPYGMDVLSVRSSTATREPWLRPPLRQPSGHDPHELGRRRRPDLRPCARQVVLDGRVRQPEPVGGCLLRPGCDDSGDHGELAVRGASSGATGRPAGHALLSQSTGSGSSASRIVIGRSLVAGLSLSP